MLKERSSKWPTSSSEHVHPIVVEDYLVKKQPPEKWIPELDLYLLDRDVLLNPEAWVTDSIVDAAQTLIKQSSPVGGLQKVCCGLTMSFTAEPSEFIQILCTSRNGDHWLLVSTIGCVYPTVMVYDSKYRTVNKYIEKQIALLYHCTHREIRLQFINTQMQYGGSDCGLFAVAFATALALQHNPEHYHFVQDKLRSHLLRCFQDGKMTMFPYDRTRRARNRIKNECSFGIYCTCRLPKSGNMIECSKCKEWYHINPCVQVPKEALKRGVQWICQYCLSHAH